MSFRALSLAVCLAFAGAGAASAQSVPEDVIETIHPVVQQGAPEGPQVAGIALSEWTSFALLAEGIVEPRTATNFALTRVRSELLPWRDRFANALNVNAARLGTLDRQIAALSPAEGVTETNPVILDRLAVLGALRGRLAQPQKLALEAYARADGLINEIDGQIRLTVHCSCNYYEKR